MQGEAHTARRQGRWLLASAAVPGGGPGIFGEVLGGRAADASNHRMQGRVGPKVA